MNYVNLLTRFSAVINKREILLNALRKIWDPKIMPYGASKRDKW